jgi:putative transposase
MARKKGQTYTAEQKAKIVLEVLKEERTINQIASEFKVTIKSIQNWKKQFLENASLAFDTDKATEIYKKELKAKEAEIDELAKALGKTTVERDWAVKKLVSLDLSNKKSLVDSKLKTITKASQCKLLGISRATLYYTPRPMQEKDIKILHAMDEIYTDNPEYGYRFIHQQLLEDGYSIGNNRVLKYMEILGIQALYPTKKRVLSLKNKEHEIYPYELKPYWTFDKETKTKSVEVKTPNEVWSGDITYIRTNGGFMYLAAVIDWHSRAILSYKISNSMDATLVTEVLEEALRKYPKPKIFNTDQGSQYTGYEHTAMLVEHNIEISMNGKGKSIDNIMIERFFRTLKHSNIYISDYQSIKELKEGVNNYIYKYNFKRFHSRLNYKKPMNVYLDGLKKVA